MGKYKTKSRSNKSKDRKQSPTTSITPNLDSIPKETLHVIQSFLDQTTLIHLSHANKNLYNRGVLFQKFFIPVQNTYSLNPITKGDVLEVSTKSDGLNRESRLDHLQRKGFIVSRNWLRSVLPRRWRFEKCRQVELNNYNVFAQRCLESMKMLAPTCSRVRFTKPIQHLRFGPQELRRFQKRFDLLDYHLVNSDQTLQKCRCGKMTAVRGNSCPMCAPNLVLASELQRAYVENCGMSAVKNYFFADV